MAKSSLADLVSLQRGTEAAAGWAGLLTGAGTLPTASVRVCRGARGAGGAAQCSRHLQEGDRGDLPPEHAFPEGWQWPTGIGFPQGHPYDIGFSLFTWSQMPFSSMVIYF